MNLQTFERNFNGYPLSQELALLMAFQEQHTDYAAGFRLIDGNLRQVLNTWNDQEDFTSRIMPFAEATASGSYYALWNDGSGGALDKLAVIVLGDEGDIAIVAQDTRELMHLLTFDCEVMLFDGTPSFYKRAEDDYESDDAGAYRAWLKENFNLEAITDPGQIVEAAQKQYGATFGKWLAQYVTL